jgi:hypothetical protein
MNVENFKKDICKILYDQKNFDEYGICTRGNLNEVLKNEKSFTNMRYLDSILMDMIVNDIYITINPADTVSNTASLITLTYSGRKFAIE